MTRNLDQNISSRESNIRKMALNANQKRVASPVRRRASQLSIPGSRDRLIGPFLKGSGTLILPREGKFPLLFVALPLKCGGKSFKNFHKDPWEMVE
jgi:hypothetical protein